MSDLEFDDDDDVLLKALDSPSSALLKRLSEEASEATPPKRTKLGDSEAPLLPKGSPVQSALKRLFPGPAGLLADGHESTLLNQMDLICSQKSSSIFLEGPWTEMSKDFRISTGAYLYDKFNIAWIKKEAAANKFVNQKAPFLAAVLFSLEVSEGQAQKSVNVTLKDLTGAIQGTILPTLYEEHSVSFTLGSVVVLTDFGVLSCSCDKCDNQHLTVTPKNLSAIYSNNKSVIIKKIDAKSVLSDYNQREAQSRSLNTSFGGCVKSTSSVNYVSSSNGVKKSVVEAKKNEESNKRLFTFKKPSSSVQVEGTSSAVVEDIWKDALKDVDINSLFSDDFDCD